MRTLNRSQLAYALWFENGGEGHFVLRVHRGRRSRTRGRELAVATVAGRPHLLTRTHRSRKLQLRRLSARLSELQKSPPALSCRSRPHRCPPLTAIISHIDDYYAVSAGLGIASDPVSRAILPHSVIRAKLRPFQLAARCD